MRHNDRELWQDFRRATDDAQAHECVPASAFYQLADLLTEPPTCYFRPPSTSG